MSNENSDKIYGILRDLTNGAITIENAFARIKGLTDASELEADSYSDDQKSELNETDVDEEAVIDRPDVAVQVVQNPETPEDTEKAQEEAEVEEKPTRRRKKKTAEDDETDTTATDK